ncbi:MAG TPA: hypothetical protein VJ831_12390 [Jatrophihabitantaceae bacterium]|nr:hypothetical protein [Jatrophihabitantaceae bacterium]
MGDGSDQPRAAELADVRAALVELAPVLRRAARLDPASIARLRIASGSAAVFVRLPFGVLVARTIRDESARDLDVVVRASEALDWLDEAVTDAPTRRDHDWRGGVPPSSGWTRIDTVPDDVVRGLVRTGATTLKELAEREGVPGAEPRAELSDALLDSVVLTVTGGDQRAEVTLRVLSAVTRMGFLPRGSHVAVDVSGRWIRVAAEFGSVYHERPGGLGLL